ncbi:MAG TPA: Mth938-like domain-containing protein [Alphaproteobacteria bacterium]|nr:Mth938-like domain-containing protein [Alphaproteobacteria bacterium]
MEIAPLQLAGRQLILGYGKSGFLISDVQWRGAILVFPDRVMPWAVTGLQEVSLASFAPVREYEPIPDIMLIGTGSRMAMLPSALRAELRSFGLAIETMDTGAACRTYNLLLGEERRVAAALLPIH